MAKSASPIRLQEDLMQAAVLTSERFHRSTAEQIEYWAEMGRNVSQMLDPDDLLSISAGLAKIRVEPVHSEPIDPGEVFQSLEAERASGILLQTVTSSSIKYQISLAHPDYLEQINPDGTIKTGKFQGGIFIEYE
ncbi:MAG: hypothetical protein H0X02_06470 [Nitrosomonas sp.]|nr:hypothetical protein [Nitrosomonas sp.]